MKPCKPFEPENEGQRLVQTTADLYLDGGSLEQWRSLACDLAARVAVLEVRLRRLHDVEQVLTLWADHTQLVRALDTLGGPENED